jgi:GAF domain-containing protein
MSEHLIIQGDTKQERYEALLPQIEAVVEGEPDLIANMANVAAMLHETFGFWWTGFYRVEGDELVLGPFQGPMACTRIKKGRGVCGTAWAEAATQVVPDVDKFPGHIACSSASRSEIVVPVFQQGQIIAVLDIDSERLSTFDQTDRHYLEQITFLIANAR